jgi:hypothetical protein
MRLTETFKKIKMRNRKNGPATGQFGSSRSGGGRRGSSDGRRFPPPPTRRTLVFPRGQLSEVDSRIIKYCEARSATGKCPLTNQKRLRGALAVILTDPNLLGRTATIVVHHEYAPEPNPETKKKDIVWFAHDDDRPLSSFAGIWTDFKGDRGTKSKPIPGRGCRPRHLARLTLAARERDLSEVHRQGRSCLSDQGPVVAHKSLPPVLG